MSAACDTNDGVAFAVPITEGTGSFLNVGMGRGGGSLSTGAGETTVRVP